MLNFFKKYQANIRFRLVFLLLALLIIFGFASGRFIFVKAYDNQAVVFPGSFETVQADGDLMWEGAPSAFFQDLSERADIIYFNHLNSAFIRSPLNSTSTIIYEEPVVPEYRDYAPFEPVIEDDPASSSPDSAAASSEPAPNAPASGGGGGGNETSEEEVNTADEGAGAEQSGRDGAIVIVEVEPVAGITVEDEPVETSGNTESSEGAAGASNDPAGSGEEPVPVDASSEAPAPEPEPVSAPEPTPEPAPEPTPEPAPEPTPEPAPEPTPAPVDSGSEVSFWDSFMKNISLSWQEITSPLSAWAQMASDSPDIIGEIVPATETTTPADPDGRISATSSLGAPDPATTTEGADEAGPGEGALSGQSLVFSDFFIPLEYKKSGLGRVKLLLSLAARSHYTDDRLVARYTLDGNWRDLGVIYLGNEVSNALNGDYFRFALPPDLDWGRIDDLKISLSYLQTHEEELKEMEVYLDALWLEVDYNKDDEEESEEDDEDGEYDAMAELVDEANRLAEEKKKGKKKAFELELLNGQTTYKFDEILDLRFRYDRQGGLLSRFLSAIADIFTDEYDDLEIEAYVESLSAEANDEVWVEYLGDGEFSVKIDPQIRAFKPGKQTLNIIIKDGDNIYSQTQDFTWGVLAFNVDKSVYLPGETAYIQLAVLDENGNTLCDVDSLSVEIERPDNTGYLMSLENEALTANPACGPNNVIDTPDFYGYFETGGVGEYAVRITARTPNGEYEITDIFEVWPRVPFTVERTGPTRIYPWAGYTMTFRVTAEADYQGEFREIVPSGFQMVNENHDYGVYEFDKRKELVWDLDLEKGEQAIFQYTFDAPNVSPEFYLLGPASVGNFEEIRRWQIASDAEVGYVLAEHIGVDSGTIDQVNWTEIVRATSTYFTAGDAYLVYVTAGFAGSGGTGVTTDYEIRYGSDVQYTGLVEAPGTENDATQISWFDVYTQPGTPENISIHYRTNSGTSYALNTQIFALNLSQLDASDWKYASNTTTTAHNPNSSFTSFASITLDAAADGVKDWFVMAMEEVQIDNTNREALGEIYDGTNSYMQYALEGEDDNELRSHVLYRTFNDVASGTAYTYRAADDDIALDPADEQNDHLKSRVIALNLDAFESHKSYYADINTEISSSTWTEIGTLNQGGNYKPYNSGDQMIFASYIKDAGSASAGDQYRIQVNGATSSPGWSWAQPPVLSKTGNDTDDELIGNAITRAYIPSAGYTIDFDAFELNDSLSAAPMADEVSLTVFSLEKLKPIDISANAQYRSDGTTAVANGGWSSAVTYLSASASDVSSTTSAVDFYFEVIGATSSPNTSYDKPANTCSNGTAYDSCNSKIWKIATSTRSQVVSPSNWYDVKWRYRKAITINSSQVDDDLNDFPVLATTTDSDLADHAHAQGYDILFTLSDGTTKIPHEIEYYASSTGQLVAWVKTDLSSTTDTALYMYYGYASTTTDYSDAENVWDSNYVMVQHLQESGGAVQEYSLDSTSNNNDGYASGTSVAHTNATPIDGAWDVSGANQDRVEIPDSASLRTTSALTASAWAYADSWTSPDHNPVFWKGSQIGWGGTNYLFRIAVSGGTPTWGVTCGTTEGWVGGGSVSTGAWYYYTLIFDGTNTTAYVNGSQVATDTDCSGQTLNGLSGYPVRSGFGYRDTPSTETHFDGRVNELRMSNIARSPEWISTEYNNQLSVGSFLAIGAESAPTESVFAAKARITGLPESSTGYRWQVFAVGDDGSRSVWDPFNTTVPNFKVDATDPTVPGSLTEYAKTSASVSLDFGNQSSDANFDQYKIYYKEGSSGVTTNDSVWKASDDSNLDYANYGGAAYTTVTGLQPETEYVFNIWACDLADNCTPAVTELSVTTAAAGRARSITYYAGSWFGTGSSTDAKLTDTNYNLPAFNFRLAEDDVGISSAYIIFEAHIEAFNNYGDDHTGYNLAFDMCQEPCTPNPFSGIGRVLKADNTILVYRESESTQVRVLFDVTEEAQLSSYSGGWVNMDAAVGYRIETGSAQASIAGVRAQLVVNYTHDASSESITNTVIYPLDSTDGTDSGSRQSQQTDDCTLDWDCPTFTYQVDIPEYSSSPGAQRVSQWFQTYNFNDGNGGDDLFINVNIEGNDATSATYVHESALGGTQGYLPRVDFTSVPGYSENTSQTLEYQAYCVDGNANYYTLGGEVVETYFATSTAAVKTRTVSFPIGLVNPGLTWATSTAGVDVYFPENGVGGTNVDIKKAWLRVIGNNSFSTSTDYIVDITSRVGDNSTSSLYRYEYNPGGTVIKNSFTMIHILPSADYAELESADAENPKTVLLTVRNDEEETNSAPYQGSVSAELMITYIYSSEAYGYLNSLRLFAGQSETNANTSTSTLATAPAMFPEKNGKTVLAGALLSHLNLSDSDGNVPAAQFYFGSDLDVSAPAASNGFTALSDGVNSFIEYYHDVTSALAISNDQAYTAQYTVSDGGDDSAGAKMGGQLVYTYMYYPPSPVSVNTIDQYKADGFTSIPNGDWTDEDEVNLSAQATDSSTSTLVSFYFQVASSSDSFITASAEPAGACDSGTAWGLCSSKVWNDTASTASDWYDPDWVYRKKLTINAGEVSDDLTDFPVLATTTDADFAHTGSGGHMASTTGADIVITDSDAVTPLDYQREFYDPATGEIVLWIETTLSSTTNKELYIYYGNSAIDEDMSSTTGVWDDDYVGVWHLEGEYSGAADEVTDSSLYNNHGTAAGLSGQRASGWIGYAQDFDNNRYIDCGNDSSTDIPDSLTMSAWVRHDSAGTGGAHIINRGGGWDDNGYSLFWYESANDIRVELQGSTKTMTDNSEPAENTWVYITVTWTNDSVGGDDTVRVYYDGVQQGTTGDYEGPMGTPPENLSIGRKQYEGYYFHGLIDEPRLSKVARSPEWIETEASNQKSVASFISFDSAEDSYASPVLDGSVNVTGMPDSAAGYKWQVKACNDNGFCSAWDLFDISPNFKIDSVMPDAPGNLTVATTTATTITLDFGAEGDDANFSEYRVYYKIGISGVDTGDTRHTDANLSYKNYNNATSTTLTNLESNTQYVINIWTFDAAGNYAGATEVKATTLQADHARGRTVQFYGGDYTGDGSSGQLTDTDQSFSTFNWQLAETEAEIRDAFVLFESQIESYYDTSDNYTGYNLAFDTCAEPCTADAWSGADRVLKDDNSILVYDETESDQIRLLFDVTEEAQLAAYAGDNSQMEAQIGYRIEKGAATTSIASARALLFVTYSYDSDNSTNYTNTVVYPLDSQDSGDSGSRRSIQSSGCTKTPAGGADCPLFSYNMQIPELDSKLSQWFEIFGVNDGHGTTDVDINANVESSDVDSDTYIHESSQDGTQDVLPGITLDDIFGFSENQADALEIYHSAGNMYALGGEVFETYTAAKTAGTKTRTVSFPVGVLTNGQSVSTASSSVDIYFPENGEGSGVVDIKSAWFRVIGNVYNTPSTYSLTLSSKAGDNAQSGNYIYNVDVGSSVIKPSFTVIHIIPSTDYSELESANADAGKTVVLYATNGDVSLGGVSAELMVTYSYTSESTGYLASMNLYGGQTDVNANATEAYLGGMNSFFPELRGDKSLLSNGLLSSYLITPSDNGMPGTWFTVDADMGTSSTPVYSTDYYVRPDGFNGFFEYYDQVSPGVVTTIDNTSYTTVLANYNDSDSGAGAKMNTVWNYTYQWDAVPPELTQADWRWYDNVDAVQPTVAKAAENTAVNSVNIGDVLRLRMSVGVTREDMSAGTQTFKLQYGRGSDCTAVSIWSDVGGLTDSTPWRGYNNPDPADGAALTAALLASSTAYESYEESNSSASNPNSVSAGGYGEWDWVVYNHNASSTTDYCFRMIKGSGSVFDDYLSDSYPKLTTAASNTPPADPGSLAQFRDDGVTPITRGAWINENDVQLVAQATDPNMSETITLYFEVASSSDSFTTSTTTPTGACVYGSSWAACDSKIWYVAPASPGDYRADPYVGTTSITSIPESASGFKWHVLACDDSGSCSEWSSLGNSPHFRIDTTPPQPPGNLSFVSASSTSIVLGLGASSTEDNFSQYKVFYRAGVVDVTIYDTEHDDTNFDNQWYNNATTTTVDNLSADTAYVFNIWAYDLAGNIATATTEVVGTTTASFNPPTGSLVTVAQKTNGSGVVDIAILVDDPDNNDTLRAKVFYEAGTDCNFDSMGDPTLDETDANITSTYGDPDIDNQQEFQVGTSTNWIITSPGQNYVFFDWFGITDLPAADGDYCMGLVVNDGGYNQVATHTRTFTLDNVDPGVPGALTIDSKTDDSITLDFGAQSSDTNFDRYRIFYKVGTSGVAESDTEHSDSDLLSANYGGTATTTITGLTSNTYYVINIWAYDDYGNKATSTEIFTKTNSGPTNISADTQYESDWTVLSNGSWTADNDLIFEASVHDKDATDTITFYYEVIAATGTFSSLTNPPGSACNVAVSWPGCNSKIWAVATTTSNLPSTWYDKDWYYRKPLTVDALEVMSTESGYPLLVNLTDSDLAAKARNDGLDIIFTDTNGTSTLDFELEYYNPSTGELAAWVKTDISSTTDKIIYMYYGNAENAADMSTTTALWDSDYAGVWHLDENVTDEGSAANAHNDSTANNNDGDQYGNNEYSSYIGQGQEFDGDDYILVDDDSALDITDAITLEAWVDVNAGSVWTYSRNITFDNATPLNDYQVEIELGPANFDYTKADSNGADLRFYDTSDNSLSYWIERWNTSGSSTVWVKIPDAGTTQISMKYGNSGASAQSDIDDVMDQGGLRYHYYDGMNFGTWQGTDRDTAMNFSFGDVRVYIDSGNSWEDQIDTLSIRWEGWVKRGIAGQHTYWIGGDDGVRVYVNENLVVNGWADQAYTEYSGNYTPTYEWEPIRFEYYENTGSARALLEWDIGSGRAGIPSANLRNRKYSSTTTVASTLGTESSVGIHKAGAYALSFNQSTVFASINDTTATTTLAAGWNYVVMTYDRTAGTNQLKLYVNGQLQKTAALSEVINSNSSDLYIGDDLNSYIDEVRISDIARAPSQVETQYNNQVSASTMVDAGSEGRVQSFYETALVLNMPDNSTGYKWQAMACDDDGDCSGWDTYNDTTPNFKIDTTPPSAPGALTENAKTSNSVTLNFGAQTNEDNFSTYKIFYATSSPTESDSEHSDSNLAFINYNGESITTVAGLRPDTQYYFNIWAYDEVGNKASSTPVAVTTSIAVTSPGALFYTKGESTLYYRVWDGSDWGVEQAGPSIGSTPANFVIRHVEAVRSDDGGKVGLLVKASSTTGVLQEWWGTVYRFVADDFASTTQLGAAETDGTNDEEMAGCIAALSGKEFMAVRTNNGADGTLVYSWNASDGWTAEGAGPNPAAVLNGCTFVRRPNTDNYLLMTFDDDNDVGSSYYYGGSTYANSWTSWTQHSAAEENINSNVRHAFFDQTDNTRGALYYSNSGGNLYAYARYFIAGNSSINYGGSAQSPDNGSDDWNDDFVNGEFAPDPGGSGIAYFIGQDIDRELNVYQVDASNPVIQWATTTNGDNISGGELYEYNNYSVYPYAMNFYKSGSAVIHWNERSAAMPRYHTLTTGGNTVSALDSVPGASTDLWTRVRIYDDPSEDEYIAVYQNDNVDYSAVFYEGGMDRFYASTTHPGNNQAWTDLATSTSAVNINDDNYSFAFTSYNSSPNTPASLGQFKSDASTTIANQDWTNENSVTVKVSVTDDDTEERIKVYLELIADSDTFTSSSSEPANACAASVDFDDCNSKIWDLGTSTLSDYSVTPYTVTATISSTSDSDLGYKWRVMACDDDSACTAWTQFNATTPNFYVDTVAPTIPGDLTITNVTSQTVTLEFGATSTEDNFDEYRIYYKEGALGVTTNDTEHNDSDLTDILYYGTTNTIVTSLASTTQYVFNIWAFDLAGNIATATTEVSTTTKAAANIEQTSYLLENDDGVNVNSNTAEVAVDTALNNVRIGQRILARIQIENDGEDIFSGKTYRLQFQNQTDGGAWTNVGAATQISYAYGLSGANNADIISSKAALNSNTWINGKYYENTGQSGSITLDYGRYTELVFAVKTNNALVGKTYRLRLYNQTDGKTLNVYTSYPTINTIASDTLRYTKQTISSLPSAEADLTYYFDAQGYNDINADDSTADPINSSSNIPIFLFAAKHTNNTDAISITWTGSSTVAAGMNNVILQVYQYAAPDVWVTVDTEAAAGAGTEFSLTANINSNLSTYYDGSYWTYWRVYQTSGTQTLNSDYFNASFAAPTPEVTQEHYRWREDDGSQTAATWREIEDTGDPTPPTTNLERNNNIRVRVAVSNLGGGTASGYTYGIEYASSTGTCTGLSGWSAVTTDGSGHWDMATSSYFTNGDPTTSQLSTDGNSFVAGIMVDYTATNSSAIDLDENEYTEIEYAIYATNHAATSGTYCFRVTDNGAVLDDYDEYPILTLAGTTNNAPSITNGPSDGGSASTSPTNYGNDVVFTATADDPEDDDYYLAVCKTAFVSAGNDGPPTCTGGEWCVSGVANDTEEATCNYTTADASEALVWYVFVCDKKPGFGIAQCSSASQGAGTGGANDSPFVINHPPAFTGVSTTDNNKDPGGTFTVTAVAADNDTQGGADLLRLHVCTTNDASYAGCGGTTLCTVAATSSPDAACSFTDTAPTPAGNYTYYAFIYDSHGVAASANSRSSTYTINNVAPVLGELSLNGGGDITLNIKPGETTVQTINTSVTDQNGCDTGLVSATAVIYMSDATNGYNCSQDDNDCYPIGTGNCVKSDCTDDSDTIATYTCAANLKYFAIPTDNSDGNPWEPYGWLSRLRVYDGSNYIATTSSEVEVESTIALSIVESLIDFDRVGPGENTGTANSTSTVENYGNSPIDSNISGIDMDGNPSGTIDVNNIKWSLAGFDYPFETDFLDEADTLVDIAAPKPTDATAVQDEIYWGIGVPGAAPAGDYEGRNTFTVSLDIDGW